MLTDVFTLVSHRPVRNSHQGFTDNAIFWHYAMFLSLYFKLRMNHLAKLKELIQKCLVNSLMKSRELSVKHLLTLNWSYSLRNSQFLWLSMTWCIRNDLIQYSTHGIFHPSKSIYDVLWVILMASFCFHVKRLPINLSFQGMMTNAGLEVKTLLSGKVTSSRRH